MEGEIVDVCDHDVVVVVKTLDEFVLSLVARCSDVCIVRSFSDRVGTIGGELDTESMIWQRWFTRRRFSR